VSFFMAAIYDRFMRGSEEACLRAWRGELLGEAAGDVLEIGAGTGANLPHYGDAVQRLVLAEPDRHMRAKLEARLKRTPRRRTQRLETSAAPSDALPFADASFDAVVSTLVLCSVADVARTLAEIRRVLRPGGRLLFLEHVAADEDPSRLAWQRRVEPAWKLVAGNCHLTRRTAEAIRAARFDVAWERRESVRKALPIVRTSVRGVARRP
jgi:ubiquinone/menaquinone biosynthesis C-methylase UbiE